MAHSTACPSRVAPGRVPCALRGHGSLRGLATEKTRDREPCEWKKNEQVTQVLTVDTVGTERLRRIVPRLASRGNVCFGGLVERADQELNDEYEQEYRGDLEKPGQVHAVAVPRPEPGDERRRGGPRG